MRGLFSAGVIDVMMENGIEFDGIIGTSAGAAFGCNYKSRQPGRVIRYNIRFAHEPRFCSFRSLLTTGDLYGAEFCYHTLPMELDPMDAETYKNNPVKFYVNATDADTGEAVYHEIPEVNDEGMEYMRASASMPVVSKPVEIDGKRLLDGGIADSIPVRAFEKMGYTHNVIVLTQPEGFRKTPQKALPVMKLLMKDMPKIPERLKYRYIVYNDTLDYIHELEKEGKALVIRPPAKLEIGKIEHDTVKIREIYDLGRRTGEEYLERVRAFLDQPE